MARKWNTTHTHTILEWETKKWDMKERMMVGIRHGLKGEDKTGMSMYRNFVLDEGKPLCSVQTLG
jgi:hypothetical protein